MNGTEKYLIDTNILIYFFDGKFTEKQKEAVIKIFEKSFTISVISKIEFLGFKEFFGSENYEKAKEFVSQARVLPLSDEIIETIIDLKQAYKLKLGDAIIAATAKTYDFELVTRNVKDFDEIPGLIIFNPFTIE